MLTINHQLVNILVELNNSGGNDDEAICEMIPKPRMHVVLIEAVEWFGLRLSPLTGSVS